MFKFTEVNALKSRAELDYQSNDLKIAISKKSRSFRKKLLHRPSYHRHAVVSRRDFQPPDPATPGPVIDRPRPQCFWHPRRVHHATVRPATVGPSTTMSSISAQGVVERASAELSKRINGLGLRKHHGKGSVMERVTNVFCGNSAPMPAPEKPSR